MTRYETRVLRDVERWQGAIVCTALGHGYELLTRGYPTFTVHSQREDVPPNPVARLISPIPPAAPVLAPRPHGSSSSSSSTTLLNLIPRAQSSSRPANNPLPWNARYRYPSPLSLAWLLLLLRLLANQAPSPPTARPVQKPGFHHVFWAGGWVCGGGAVRRWASGGFLV